MLGCTLEHRQFPNVIASQLLLLLLLHFAAPSVEAEGSVMEAAAAVACSSNMNIGSLLHRVERERKEGRRVLCGLLYA